MSITYEKFLELQKTVQPKQKDSAGTLIFNHEFTRILLVKGKYAKKWGPPKGHREPGESELTTALRETYEETGIRLKFPILPSIIINKVKLYGLTISESTPLTIRDTNEIIEINWFNLDQLRTGHVLTSLFRKLIETSAIINGIIQKVRSFEAIHSTQSLSPIGHINNLVDQACASEQASSLRNYWIYNMISTQYGGFFSENDIYCNFILSTA
jgi:8-oxo-dGTP pyrophosphatase MutT (NUDIX family)